MPKRDPRKHWWPCSDCGAPALPPSGFCRRANEDEWPEGCYLGDPFYYEGVTVVCPGCGETFISCIGGNENIYLRLVEVEP